MAHCRMKFRLARARFVEPAPRTLDSGCGSGSPALAKRCFPSCHYARAGIHRYRLSDADMAAMEAYFPPGADGVGYDAIFNSS